MDELIAVLKGDRSAGLYQLVTPISTDDLVALSQAQGARLFYINGTFVKSKADFLQAVAKALMFPDYFGNNWDALEDCLTDLDWLTDDRLILLYEQPETFAQHAPSEWLVALDILRSTADYWHTRDRSFSVFIKSSDTDLIGLDTL
jgi:hypothetical protein